MPTANVLPLDFTNSHVIYKNAAGKRLPGVTTVLGMLAKPQLLKWAWQLGKDGKDLDRSRQVAADVGTVAHGLAEAHLRGMTLDTASVSPDTLAPAETSFLRFLDWWDRGGFTVVASECQMVSERLQVGGTADIIARRPDGALVLCDLKSGRAIYPEMFVQVAVYAAMYEETSGQHIEDVQIVRVGKDINDSLETRSVEQRAERLAAFEALATARRLLQVAGMKL